VAHCEEHKGWEVRGDNTVVRLRLAKYVVGGQVGKYGRKEKSVEDGEVMMVIEKFGCSVQAKRTERIWMGKWGEESRDRHDRRWGTARPAEPKSPEVGRR